MTRYRAEVPGAAYDVECQDSAMGGVALHGFVSMLWLSYGLRRVELVIEDQTLRFRSRAVVEALLSGSVKTTLPVPWVAG